MGHLENKLEWCIKKGEEGKKHRGLTMIYLIKGNFPDWAVSASFYSMYHCLLAILVKHGYESRNQECTSPLE